MSRILWVLSLVALVCAALWTTRLGTRAGEPIALHESEAAYSTDSSMESLSRAQSTRMPPIELAEPPAVDSDAGSIDASAPARRDDSQLGVIEARILDLRSRPVADGTSVMLITSADERGTDVPDESPSMDSTQTSSGMVRFAGLRANSSWELVLFGSNYPHCRWSATAAVEANASQGSPLRMSKGAWLVYGVMQDANDVPLRERELAVRWQAFDGTVFEWPIRTSAEGDFFVQIWPDVHAPPKRLLMRDEVQGESAFLELSETAPGLSVDVGTLRLTRDEEFLSGIVLGADGEPRAKATIEFEALLEESQASCDPLQSPTRFTTTCDASGRFRCVGPRFALGAPHRYRVRARSGGESSAFVVVERGASGVALSMSADGRLNVRVLIPPEVFVPLLETRLLSSDGEELPVRVDPSQVGVVELVRESIPAGTYRFELELSEIPDWRFALANLEIPIGGACADPRVREIDLRAKLRVVSFGFELEGDVAVPKRAMLLAESLDESTPAVLQVPVLGDGVLHAILPEGRYAGLFIAGGSRAVRLEVLRSYQVLLLSSGVSVVLTIDAESQRDWLASWLRPSLHLQHAGTMTEIAFESRSRGEAGGAAEACFSLPAAGTYALTWSPPRGHCGMEPPPPVLTGEPLHIEVRESDGEQRFRVSPPPRPFR